LGRLILDADGFGTAEATWWDFVRDIRDECVAAGVPVFVRQIPLNGRLSKDPSEWPEDLRFQEMPHGAEVAPETK
jgi:hypothetical protein